MLNMITILFTALTLMTGTAWAETITVPMATTTTAGNGQSVGTITVSDTPYGALFTPDLSGLPPGLHGFHVHEKGDCAAALKDGKTVPGLAAGGHFDPSGTGRHEGPYGNGHLGDLPPLYVDADGHSTVPVLAPRLKAADVRYHSLMIHAGGDNFSDQPAALGGGGARIACGVAR